MSDQAPLPRYDELTTAEIESHARTLEEPALRDLLEYERAHADRVQVVQLLEHRLDALTSGATPSGGDPSTTGSGREPAPPREPASPSTEGPPQNVPSHGVPTNTTQPRR